MNNRRQVVAGFLVPVVVGLAGLSNVTRQPRFEMFHAVDVVQLVATGMCFGAALVFLVMSFRSRLPN